MYPDDESCLALETKAVALLNGCYRQPELCSLMSESNHSEIHSIVNAFRIGSHYHNNTLVDMGLPNAILETCSSSNHTELAKSLTTSEMPVRVLLCATSFHYVSEGSAFNETGYIEQIKIALNRSNDQITYFGDDTSSHWCSTVPNPSLTFEIFAWFADAQDPLLSLPRSGLFVDQAMPNYYIKEADYYYFQVHETEEERREPSQCGDGIRQIGETCDVKNNIGNGCLRDCTVHRDYSCSTDTLSPSVCQIREEERQERIPCPKPRRRSRVAHSRLTKSTGSFQVEHFVSSGDSSSSGADSVRTLNASLVTLFAVIAICLSKIL